MPFTLPPLYPLLDTACVCGDLTDAAHMLADAGVTCLQLRAKNSTREEVLRLAEWVRAGAADGMTLVLNDHAELVREAGFNGVHLGQSDLSVAEARALLGPDAIIGLSTHTPEQAAAGDESDADYLACGPVFATVSKADAKPIIGLAGVRSARAATGKPLVAIGGITLANAAEVWASGADSIAVIGALWSSGGSPGAIARDFLRLFR